jgi:hypothetical protein
LDPFALRGRARLTTIDLALDPAALAKKPKPSPRALFFGSEEKKDGAQELQKTGRALGQLYPDDLDRAVGRDREVEELARLLASPDRRAIVLVGPRKVGKTTILHELAWRIASRKKERYARGRQIWLVSPMRLISGMSVLGEWESRVLAILEHAQQLDRVLYFDDLLGLLTAGMHSGSDLNVAQVLRPALEQRRVRVIAEITPEAWRVLRERPFPNRRNGNPGVFSSPWPVNWKTVIGARSSWTRCPRCLNCTSDSPVMPPFPGRQPDFCVVWRCVISMPGWGDPRCSKNSRNRAGCNWRSSTRAWPCRGGSSSRPWRVACKARRRCWKHLRTSW